MPQAEFEHKRTRVAAWLDASGADAVLLLAAPNLYWLSAGGELRRVTTSSVAFVVTRDRTSLLVPSDDADRVRQEEVRGFHLELVPLVSLGVEALVERARGLLPRETRWRCDVPGYGIEHDPSIDLLRRSLLPEEIERLRKLGHDAATAIEEVAAECFRGILERDAAARLAAECVRRQIVPRVLLAGADERLATYARPVPKGGCAEQTLLLALVGMRGGLHVALSRIICLVQPEDAFVERYQGALDTVAELCHRARDGATLGQVVQQAIERPALHAGHLGGLAGYALPEVEARPSSAWRLEPSQPLVWSVALPGARCEDTWLLGKSGCELVTATEGWPRRTLHLEDRTYELPDLLLL